MKIKKLELKNFLSFGNVKQELYLNNNSFNLILGENLDVGNNVQNNRNGSGKTSILNAISYALFGQPLLNIRKDNCINVFNEKNMEVSVIIEKNGFDYEIRRGRKPNFFVLKNLTKNFIIHEKEENSQEELEKIIGFNFDVFRHIIALNTFSESFFNLRHQEQKDFIETIFGIKELSLKSEILKEKIKQTKDEIQKESITINSLERNNQNILRIIEDQKNKSEQWNKEKKNKISSLEQKLKKYFEINFDNELLYLNDIENLENQFKEEKDKKASLLCNIKELEKQISFLERERDLTKRTILSFSEKEEIRLLDESIKDLINELNKNTDTLDKLKSSLEEKQILLEKEHIVCHFCNTKIKDKKHLDDFRRKLNEEISFIRKDIFLKEKYIDDLKTKIEEKNKQKSEKEKFIFDQIQDLEKRILEFDQQIKNNQIILQNYVKELNMLNDKIENILSEIDKKRKKMFYSSKEEMYKDIFEFEKIKFELEKEKNERNPYIDYIEELQKEGLKKIDYENLNNLRFYFEHQEFLFKLLTNKDSFIRKKIMDQNLNFLNTRLCYYLNELNVQHKVKFLNDLSFEINYIGREVDYDNLSRGEKTRLSLALAWAFRDIYENLHDEVNLIFVDEFFDSGLDFNGIECSSSILKKMVKERNKTVFIISHREELISKADKIFLVRKENGFSTILENQ
ncbi:MAG: AAA family ATPase [Candidatus Dojkabacteria bacterium]|nr:AAA family ATPase [Candidatus Dojkabacteria bacterium]